MADPATAECLYGLAVEHWDYLEGRLLAAGPSRGDHRDRGGAVRGRAAGAAPAPGAAHGLLGLSARAFCNLVYFVLTEHADADGVAAIDAQLSAPVARSDPARLAEIAAAAVALG